MDPASHLRKTNTGEGLILPLQTASHTWLFGSENCLLIFKYERERGARKQEAASGPHCAEWRHSDATESRDRWWFIADINLKRE